MKRTCQQLKTALSEQNADIVQNIRMSKMTQQGEFILKIPSRFLVKTLQLLADESFTGNTISDRVHRAKETFSEPF